LEQNGGSTPYALKLYAIDENADSDDDERFVLMHTIFSRIIESPIILLW
jgi:fructose-bisphosphate aldolase class 1